MNRQLASFAVAALASLPGMAGAQSIEPGLWEITVTLQATGTAQPQQHTTQRCYSRQELNDLQNVAPSAGMGAQCKLLNSNQSGNRYSFALQCEQPKLASSGEFVFGATSYQGRMNTEINDPAIGKMQIAQQFSARRVGDCR